MGFGVQVVDMRGFLLQLLLLGSRPGVLALFGRVGSNMVRS